MARTNFGELLSDQPAFQNEGLLIADGVYSIKNGYAPVLAFQGASNGTLSAKALGAGVYRRQSDVYVFAATTTNIYRYQSAGYTSLVSGLSGSAAIGVSFQPYREIMLATNGVNPIKKFDPTAPTVMTNLGGTPPTARFLATVGGFVLAGYVDDDDLTLAWSDNGAPEVWTPGTGDAGQQTFASGGAISGLVSGDYGLIIQENRVQRITQTFDDTVWQFDDVSPDIGCAMSKSIASWNRTTFFWSERGFMMCDGANLIPIGEEKIDRSFASIISRTYFENVSAVVDPRNSNYIVLVASAAPAAYAYVFNYTLKRWSTAPITAELLFSALAESITLEELDAIYGNLDLIPISLDSAAFKGGASLLMMFNGSHTLGTLSGSPMQATFKAGVTDLVSDRNTRLRWVRPITDATQVTVSIKGADSLDADLTETLYSNRGPGGVYRTRENWNLMQMGFTIAAGDSWTYIQGFDADGAAGGRL